jgi:aminopeptidase N
MKRILVTILFASMCFAIPFSTMRSMTRFANSPAEAELLAPLEPLELPGYDVLKYDINLNFEYPTNYIEGYVAIDVQMLPAPPSTVRFDMGAALVAASVTANGESAIFTHEGDSILIVIPFTPVEGETITFNIAYSGYPESGYFSVANRYSNIICYTHNEPSDARNWLPCNDAPYDKAHLRFAITIPLDVDALSNGVCTDTIVGSATKTMVWQTVYPIETYLICATIGDFRIVDHGYSLFPVYSFAYP